MGHCVTFTLHRLVFVVLLFFSFSFFFFFFAHWCKHFLSFAQIQSVLKWWFFLLMLFINIKKYLWYLSVPLNYTSTWYILVYMVHCNKDVVKRYKTSAAKPVQFLWHKDRQQWDSLQDWALERYDHLIAATPGEWDTTCTLPPSPPPNSTPTPTHTHPPNKDCEYQYTTGISKMPSPWEEDRRG